MAQPEMVSDAMGRGDQPANSNRPTGEVVSEIALSYCPRCSARLAARSCKLICQVCGYYMSCSDFY